MRMPPMCAGHHLQPQRPLNTDTVDYRYQCKGFRGWELIYIPAIPEVIRCRGLEVVRVVEGHMGWSWHYWIEVVEELQNLRRVDVDD